MVYTTLSYDPFTDSQMGKHCKQIIYFFVSDISSFTSQKFKAGKEGHQAQLTTRSQSKLEIRGSNLAIVNFVFH